MRTRRWSGWRDTARQAFTLLRQATDRTAALWFVLALGLIGISALLGVLAPLALKLAVDRLARESGAEAIPLALIFLIVVYGASQWLAKGSAELRTFAHTVGERRVLRRLGRRFFEHLLTLPMQDHQEHRIGALAHTLTNAMLGYRLILQQIVVTVLPLCIELPVMSGILLYLGHTEFLLIIALMASAYA